MLENVLKLKKMGWDKAGYRNGSDLPNPRLRAEVNTIDGLDVCIDFQGWQRRDASQKGCPVIQPNALGVDGCYYDNDGCGRDYGYLLRERGFDFTKFDFTQAGILGFVNSVTEKNYTSIEFI